jgi:peptidyl-prolyl cis-trans isomerase B (cyclophilin B)
MRTIALVTALILTVGGASMAEAAKANPKAKITMADGGAIVIELYPDVAPKHVENFVTLTDKGFYNGLKFHRVEPGFVVQTGDPKGDGTGGPGYTVKAEFNEKPHLEGTLGMARAQHPDSAGSQFYICLAQAPFLDRKYTVFGQVVQGMDVVKKIKRGDVMQKVEILK